MTDNEKIIEEAKKDVLPYESWKRINGETALAYAAFCIFRDFGIERNIRKAIETIEKDEREIEKRYRVWRNYSAQNRWQERAADFDRHNEQIKQSENRKTIEAQAEMHRRITGKMLGVVEKKLDTMNPDDLTQNNVIEWANMAIKTEREAAGLVSPNEKTEPKQGELSFVNDFQGL